MGARLKACMANQMRGGCRQGSRRDGAVGWCQATSDRCAPVGACLVQDRSRLHCRHRPTPLESDAKLTLQTESKNCPQARKIIGATNPLASDPGTIRGAFSIDVGRNVIHGALLEPFLLFEATPAEP